jgi:hypothetical protein
MATRASTAGNATHQAGVIMIIPMPIVTIASRGMWRIMVLPARVVGVVYLQVFAALLVLVRLRMWVGLRILVIV